MKTSTTTYLTPPYWVAIHKNYQNPDSSDDISFRRLNPKENTVEAEITIPYHILLKFLVKQIGGARILSELSADAH